jgi:hypothetical protein
LPLNLRAVALIGTGGGTDSFVGRPGVSYSINSYSCTTDNEGKASIDLEVGSEYTIYVAGSTTGLLTFWWSSNGSVDISGAGRGPLNGTVWLCGSDDGDTPTVTQYYRSLTVGSDIAGGTYTLYRQTVDDSGNPTLTTVKSKTLGPSDTTVTFTVDTAGTYVVRETEAPAGYPASGDELRLDF